MWFIPPDSTVEAVTQASIPACRAHEIYPARQQSGAVTEAWDPACHARVIYPARQFKVEAVTQAFIPECHSIVEAVTQAFWFLHAAHTWFIPPASKMEAVTQASIPSCHAHVIYPARQQSGGRNPGFNSCMPRTCDLSRLTAKWRP
jgi:hypothetical protein